MSDNRQEKKRILEILVNKEGVLTVQSMFKTKGEVVKCLTDSLRIVAMAPDNVKTLDPGQMRQGLKRFLKGKHH